MARRYAAMGRVSCPHFAYDIHDHATFVRVRAQAKKHLHWLGSENTTARCHAYQQPVLRFMEASRELQSKIEDANTKFATVQLAAAATAYEEVSQLAEKDHGAQHPLSYDALRVRAQLLHMRGYSWQARNLSTYVYNLTKEAAGPKFHERVQYVDQLVWIVRDCFEVERATSLCEEIVLGFRDMKERDIPLPWPISLAEHRWAAAFIEAGDPERALEVLNAAHKPMDQLHDILNTSVRAAALSCLGSTEEAQVMVRMARNKLEHTRNARAPNHMMALGVLPILMFVDIQLDQFGVNEAEIKDLEDALERSWAYSIRTMSLRGNNSTIPATLILISLCISQRKWKDSRNSLKKLIELLSPLEQPCLWICHALVAITLCWEQKYMEAQEHIEIAAKAHLHFFGRGSADYQHVNLLRGHILLARGQALRAGHCFEEACRNLIGQQRVDKKVQALAVEQLGLAHVCNGKSEEGRTLLLSALEHLSIPRMERAKSLTNRVLGNLAAVAGQYQEAARRFKTEFSHQMFINPADLDAGIGTVFSAWNMAWVQFELDDREDSLRRIEEVYRTFVKAFRADHKFSLACKHDLVLLKAGRMMREELEELREKSYDSLGIAHKVTKKIQQSIDLETRKSTASKDLLRCFSREYVIGEFFDSTLQLTEVDLLTWRWKPESAQPTKHSNSILANHNPLSQADNHTIQANSSFNWLESVEINQDGETKRRLPLHISRPFVHLSLELLLGFVRDFSPAFTGDCYSSSEDVPLEVICYLGTSSYTVDKVRHRVLDQVYARKILSYKERTDEDADKERADQNAMIRAEVNCMRKLSHAHIVKLCAAYVIPSERTYALLMQPVADCNLSEYLRRTQNHEDKKGRCRNLISWLPCLIQALDYMHANKVRHQDVKPDNILVHQNNVYFTDFGISKDWATRYTSKTIGRGLGTPPYTAPEVQYHQEVSRQSDVFSMGCVFAEIIYVAELERSANEFKGLRSRMDADYYYEYVEKEEFSAWFDGSDFYGRVVKGMLTIDPTERLTTKEVLSRLESCHYGDLDSLRCDHRPEQTDKA